MENDTWTVMENGMNVTLDNDTFTISLDNSSVISDGNVTATRPKLTEEELVIAFAKITFGNYYAYNFPITFVVCVVGLVTNSLNIIVFTRKNMINSVNFFLAALSVADILLISSQLPYTVHHFFGFRAIFEFRWVQGYIFLVFLESFGIMICNWLAVTIGIWRWLAINWPLRAREWCSMSRAKKILVVLVLSGLCFTLPVFLLLRIQGNELYGKILYTKDYTDLATYQEGIFLKLFWGGLVLICLVPCLILVLINGLLFKSLLSFRTQRRKDFGDQSCNNAESQRQMKKNYKTTVMLTVLLVLFVINSLPDSALVVASFFTSDDQKMNFKTATDILRMFNMVNNAISFFVYYFMGENFRATFKSIFNCKYFVLGVGSPGKKFSIQTITSDITSGTPRNSSMPNDTSMSKVSLQTKISEVSLDPN